MALRTARVLRPLRHLGREGAADREYCDERTKRLAIRSGAVRLGGKRLHPGGQQLRMLEIPSAMLVRVRLLERSLRILWRIGVRSVPVSGTAV